MERTEKERIKRVVLDFHERQEEEDYQGELAIPLLEMNQLINFSGSLLTKLCACRVQMLSDRRWH
jgi:hypothetical protein